jgi:ribonucleoside-diphosphate reductase alpha chain
MGLLSVDHPKVLEFIQAKREEDYSKWRFNISISVTNQFMKELHKGSKKAKKIIKAIADCAHYCGEPGVMFMEKFEEDNPTPSLKYLSLSPCGEVAMAPGETCQFSYINLAAFVLEKKFDFS